MTNGDTVRKMTNVELTHFVYGDDQNTLPWCTPINEECKHHGEEYECEECMLDWLCEEAPQQKADEIICAKASPASVGIY